LPPQQVGSISQCGMAASPALGREIRP
jgi:hypothetical protein